MILKFPDQSESFTYGVEYGRLLEKIERGDEYFNEWIEFMGLKIFNS